MSTDVRRGVSRKCPIPRPTCVAYGVAWCAVVELEPYIHVHVRAQEFEFYALSVSEPAKLILHRGCNVVERC